MKSYKIFQSIFIIMLLKVSLVHGQTGFATSGTTTPNCPVAITVDGSATTGIYVGKGAGTILTNTAVGVSVLSVNTTGIQNCGFGYQALLQNQTSYGNTAIGYQALANINGASSNANVALGWGAMAFLHSGVNNVGIGRLSAVTDNANNQLSIQNVIYGVNMQGGSPAQGNVGIGIYPALVGAGSIVASACTTKLHVGGTNTGTIIPSLQLDYVPSGTNAQNNFLFVDPTGVVGQTTVKGINACTSTGNMPRVDNTGNGNLECSQVYDNGTTTSVANGSNATVTWTSGGFQVSPAGTNITSGTAYKLYVNGWTGSLGYIATSDQRLKKDIVKIENPIEKISKISGYTYSWNFDYKSDRKLDSNRHAGFLAQEVLKVLPEAVVKTSDGLYGLNYNAIMPLLAEGIKAQQFQIEDQKIKIADLESKLADLSSKVNQLVPGNVIVKADNFQIVPNPVTGTSIVSYKLDASVTNAVFIVYDLQGKMLKKFSVGSNAKEGEVKLSKTDFKNGMYILSLVSNNTEIQSKRFIISE